MDMQKESPFIGTLTKATQLLVILAVGLGLLSVYFLFVEPEPAFVKIDSTGAGDEMLANADIGVKEPAAADYEPYRALFESRDIFAVPYEKEVIVPAPKLPASEPTLTPALDLDKKFHLVGIVIDRENPQAIIEDVEEGESFFLNVGDRLGDAILKKISEDRVVFQAQGQEVELLP